MFPVEKNQRLNLLIDSYNADGAGVGRANGVAVFVPETVAGETVLAQIIKVTKQYAVAKAEDILVPSPLRTEPPCPVYDRCGGCALQHMDYQEQLALKSRRIADCFSRIGHIPLDSPPFVHGMQIPFRYRNKASFPISKDDCLSSKDCHPKVGLYAKRSHRIVDVDDCLLQKEDHAGIVRAIRAWMIEHAIEPYDERTHKGLLRHVVTRKSEKGYLVCLVATGPLPHADDLIARLLSTESVVIGVVLNINRRADNVILSDEERLLYGERRIEEQLMGLKFSVSILSFMQVNPVQTQVLYSIALRFAELTGQEVVADAYCGVGTMTLLFAKHARHVYGIECVPFAIEDARQNAVLNDIRNVSFECALAETALPRLLQSGVKPDVLLLDPPRKGCDEAVLMAAVKSEIKKIVYVSCDPATLARDVAILIKAGYQLNAIEGVDMFCQTSHVECVASMSLAQDQA